MKFQSTKSKLKKFIILFSSKVQPKKFYSETIYDFKIGHNYIQTYQ